MPIPCRTLFALAALLALTAADRDTICRNETGMRGGYFHSFWHDQGAGCLTPGVGGDYRVEWRLPARGNLVAGRGWAVGAPDRVVRYRAAAFDPGANGYLTLYGWSTDPLVEYYVVDNWGDFTPPGKDAVSLGTVDSDGGTYRLYRTRRIQQPSIRGTATFDQYWSVRTVRRAVGTDATITFANHVAAWRAHGMALGTMRYQILATEGFGSSGRSDIRLSSMR